MSNNTKLVFKINLNDNLEHTLAAARYKQYWEDNQQKIIDSFYKHTGLTFKQKQITMNIIKGGVSRAGNSHQAMELSVQSVDERDIAYNLIHELAHRLVIGNGIDPPEGNKFIDTHANYYMHRHIDLFLYDVLVDILGVETAKSLVKQGSTNSHSIYAKAWKWAMTKDYSQRQKSFEQIKKRYGVQVVNLGNK